MLFDSVHKSKPKKMLDRIHKLMSEADAVVTYNGKKFDVPTLNKEYLLYGMSPPAPYKQIDLIETCKRVFRFPSNKLDYIAQTLGLGNKVKHEGHELWVKCMNHDNEAWEKMEEYNKHDVTLLEQLYLTLRPWIDRHPNLATRLEGCVCPSCGSDNYQRRGTAVTTTMKYNRYQCKDCGTWFRGNKTTYRAKPGEEKFTHVPVV